jgi:ankyrin repeat protein
MLLSLLIVTTCTAGPSTALHISARDGLARTTLLNIQLGDNVNAKDEKNATPLHYAVQNGHTETALVLIQQGAAIDAQSDYDDAPLHIAARNGYVAIVHMLIQKGANINAQGDCGDTPLYVAVQNEHTKTAQMLIEQGAQMNGQDNISSAPLHIAAENGCIEIARTLMQKGADINPQDEDGNTPLHIATQNEADAPQDDESNISAENERTIIARMLIQKGADVNILNEGLCNPLNQTMGRNYSLAQLLILNNVHVNNKDEEGWSHLCDVVNGSSNLKMVKLALLYGADINDIHNVNVTINNDRVGQLLTDTENANEFGIHGIQNGEPLATIINNGAQPTVVFEHATLDQKEALLQLYPHLFYSYLYHRDKLNDTITQHQNIPNQWGLYAAQYGNTDIMHALIRSHNNQTCKKDQWGNTAIHIAALYNRPGIIQQLLQSYAYQQMAPTSDTNPKPGPHVYNNTGFTPYDIAKYQGHKKIGRMLFTYAQRLRTISGKTYQPLQNDGHKETKTRPGKRVRRQDDGAIFLENKRARTQHLPIAQQKEITIRDLPRELHTIIVQEAITKK